VPGVSSIDALLQAAAEFVVADLDLEAKPAARAAAQRSLNDSGLLLLGEIHGVRENPLLIRALLRTFGLTSLALEWDAELAPVIRGFLAERTLADHFLLWSGDGRITAGHLAVLAERAAAGPLDVILFDGAIGMGWSWSQRDEAMAGRLLAGAVPGAPTLVVAGNAHTPTSPTSLGVPMGAYLAQQRPGVREIRINYGGGSYYNTEPARFSRASARPGPARLYQRRGALVLDLPVAAEAIVPQRPWPPAAHPPPS
jgi:hypothetical protein